MTPEGRRPCSEESLARDEAIFATASAGERWLLLELCGAWGPSAFLQSPSCIDPELGRAIVRRAEAAGLRIVAIRRHGRRPDERRWRWFIATSTVGAESLIGGEVDDPRGYLDLDLDGADGSAVQGPLVAVCAHGKHDQCCAVRGRVAAAAIADRYPEFAWECSHLGGDRFAATMLVLPEGLCYGRVDSTDGADLVTKYLDGRLDNELLRGRTSVPHAAQAAQYFARAALGEDRIDTLHPSSVQTSADELRVVLDGPDGPVEVRLGETRSQPLFSQCRATVAGPVRTFALRGVRAHAR